MWLSPCGIPNEVTLDTGGEFSSDVSAEEFTLLGVKPNYEPKWPHACLVEEVHGLSRVETQEIREE